MKIIIFLSLTYFAGNLIAGENLGSDEIISGKTNYPKLCKTNEFRYSDGTKEDMNSFCIAVELPTQEIRASDLPAQKKIVFEYYNNKIPKEELTAYSLSNHAIPHPKNGFEKTVVFLHGSASKMLPKINPIVKSFLDLGCGFVSFDRYNLWELKVENGDEKSKLISILIKNLWDLLIKTPVGINKIHCLSLMK